MKALGGIVLVVVGLFAYLLYADAKWRSRFNSVHLRYEEAIAQCAKDGTRIWCRRDGGDDANAVDFSDLDECQAHQFVPWLVCPPRPW
jgi:hypothetical protein